MSSQFIGLNVKLTLHSQPGSSLQAKILAIDQTTNTLTVQKRDGTQAVLNRSDIASLAAFKPADSTPAASADPPRSQTATPVKSQPKPKKQPEGLPTRPAAAPAFVDPAIMSYNHSANSSTDQQYSHHSLAPLHGSDPAGSRSSTPSRSPRPKPAAAQTPKSAAKKKPASASRSGSPAIANASLAEEFDFSAGLKAFDKKKIWDDIRASDHTDPASLLVSHNRISNGPIELVRGPNGVGPANSVSTPDRGRVSVKDGQQKLRPNEMVCSPSPERVPSPSPAPLAPTKAERPEQHSVPVKKESVPVPASNKPTYEQLEERIRKLEAELSLARRRNKLLEELAGLGLGVPSQADDVSDHNPVPAVSSPPQPDTRSEAQASSDHALAETAKDLSALSLQANTVQNAPGVQESLSSNQTALSGALAAAGFSVTTQEPSSPSMPVSASTNIEKDGSAAASQQTAQQEPVFGHIVSSPVLTLLFPTAALQHAALARMEAFYESDSNGKRYLSLEQAADERICRNYQGFNFPLRQGVQEWLDAMYEAVNASDEEDSPKWWGKHCNAEEVQLLDVLVTLGAISPFEGASSRNIDDEQEDRRSGRVTYVISCVASQAHSTLPHELLHALYFLSPSYRKFVAQQYASVSSANKKVIETDLGMRKYSPSVFEDEFQAYLAEGLGTEKEFGNKPAAECKDIADALRAQVAKEWSKLGLDWQSGQQQNKWEEVKWQTLDRYAAVQKANKKNARAKEASAGASPAKAKANKKGRK